MIGWGEVLEVTARMIVLMLMHKDNQPCGQWKLQQNNDNDDKMMTTMTTDSMMMTTTTNNDNKDNDDKFYVDGG